MVLAINTSILAVVFTFSAWLYWSTRVEVQAQVESSLARAAAMTDALAALKTRELSALAQSMAVSPMIRGAMATGDSATIRDVLDTLARKNGVAAVTLKPGGREGLSGRAAMEGGRELWVRQAPDRELLESWSAVTGVRYALRKPEVDDLPAAERHRYYAREVRLAGGALQATIFAERAPLWRSFEARRNSLVVLGAALFFAGLLMSALFARLIEKVSPDAAPSSGEDFQRLLDEIEAARAARGRKGA